MGRGDFVSVEPRSPEEARRLDSGELTQEEQEFADALFSTINSYFEED